jgi:hypothetical protein
VVVSLLGMLLMGVSLRHRPGVRRRHDGAAHHGGLGDPAPCPHRPRRTTHPDHPLERPLGSLLVAVALGGVALDVPVLRFAAVAAVVVVIAGRFRGPLNRTVDLTSDKPVEATAPYRWSRFVQRRAAIITSPAGSSS